MTRGKAEALVAQRRTLEGVIYDELHERIVSLSYVPGNMIFENEIAAEFGVSRTPVRQAFFRLAMVDLLEVLPQRGARVSFLSIDKVRESQEVREALELIAVAKAAEKWTVGDSETQEFDAEVDRIIAEQVAVVDAGNYGAFTHLDEDYHRAIMRFAGNMTLFDIVTDIRAHLNRIRHIEIQEAHLDAGAIVYHQEIIEAIRAKSPEKAQERLRAHLKVLVDFREEIFARRDDMFV